MSQTLEKNLVDHDIAMEAVEIFCKKHPEYTTNFGESAREKAYQDWLFHLSYLKAAVKAKEPNLFIDYLAWCKMFFKNTRLPEEFLLESFEILSQVLKNHEQQYGETAKLYLDSAVEGFSELPDETNSFITDDLELSILAQQYLNSLLRGNRDAASNLIFDAVENNVSIKKIYLQVFQTVQYEIGRLWHLNKINVAKEHYCTAVTQNTIARLYPYIFTGRKGDKRLLSSCAPGELHELGIRMVTDFFQMEGWDTYFLGADTPMESILEMVDEVKPHIIALSSTVAFNVNQVKSLIKLLKTKINPTDTKIMVGGYPFVKNQELWKKVGADAQALDAQEAITVAQNLIN